jgi:hypothetical protein
MLIREIEFSAIILLLQLPGVFLLPTKYKNTHNEFFWIITILLVISFLSFDVTFQFPVTLILGIIYAVVGFGNSKKALALHGSMIILFITASLIVGDAVNKM